MHKVFSIARNLSEAPNAPFFPTAIKCCLLKELEPLLEFHNNETKVTLSSDSLGCYLRIKRHNPHRQVVLIAHLDHPAIVFKNEQSGKALGNIISNGTRQLRANQDLSLKLYNPDGDYLFNIMAHLKQGNFSATGNNKIPPNTIGIWNVPGFQLNSETLHMRACDNLISVAILVATAHDIVQKEKPCDVTFIFPFVEEILQLSMVGVSLKKSTPVVELNKDMIFISVDVAELRTANIERRLFDELNIEIPKQDKGLVFQISDNDVVFGALSGTSRNLSESTLRNAALENNVLHQVTICEGKSDVFPLAIFTSFPNIASLFIPCANTHNLDNNGLLSYESVKIQYVLATLVVLEKVITMPSIDVSSHADMSHKLKESNLMDYKKIKRLRRIWYKAYKTNSIRLARRFFYARNANDIFHLAVGKVTTYWQNYHIQEDL